MKVAIRYVIVFALALPVQRWLFAMSWPMSLFITAAVVIAADPKWREAR